MAEILSQNQIDQLLSELSNGSPKSESITTDFSTKKIRDYDFRSPKKLSKEQQRTLFGIYENFARYLASYFSGLLRTYCEISVASIEEQPYFEYNNALPDIIMMGVFEEKPIEGPVLADISNTITFALIERLLGGECEESLTPEREFTEIEISLVEGIMHKIAAFNQEAWSHIPNISCALQQVETNARLSQSMAMDEVVAIIILDVQIKSVKGTISFCVPCINLGAVIDQISKNPYATRRDGNPEHEEALKQAMLKQIKESDIQVRGVFGSTVLTLQEILGLQEGDVIMLDQRVDSNVSLVVNGKPWFYGSPGVRRGKKAIQITRGI